MRGSLKCHCKDNIGTRFLLLALALSLSCSAPARAQQQTRRPAPEQEDEVVRITTELVRTGVAVFDKRGHFVDDLRPEQFELQVNGRTQAITFFERVRAGSRSEEAQLTAAAARGPVADRTAETNRVASAEPAEAKPHVNELLAALGALYPQRGLPVALSVGYLDTGGQGTVLNISMQLGRAALDFDSAGAKRKALVDVAGVLRGMSGFHLLP